MGVEGKLKAALGAARQRLLDTTLRNKLINFRPTKVGHLVIDGADPVAAFNALVEDGQSIRFRPIIRNRQSPTADNPENGGARTAAARDGTEPRTNSPNNFFTEAESDDALQLKLRRMFDRANSFLEEQGYNALFLALGFLRWKEADVSSTFVRSPLVLLPVELVRSGHGYFKVAWLDEEPVSNISLANKLQEQGINLPQIESMETASELQHFLGSVREAVNAKEEWSVQASCVLGFFSFAKFVMYKDLEFAVSDAAPALPGQGVMDALFVGGPNAKEALVGDGHDPPSEDEMDAKIEWNTLNHILDADPSQIQVIDAAKHGRSLVVQGPPGTGKSQTIANIISELMSAGKAVLFVSEKRAALEVVKGHLDRAAIGDFCLELHSNKITKGALRTSIQRLIAATDAGPPEQQYPPQLDHLRDELNQYAAALRTPIRGTTKTPYQVIGELSRDEPRIAETYPRRERTLFDPRALDKAEDVDMALALLKELDQLEPALRHSTTVAWKGTDPVELFPLNTEELKNAIERGARLTEKLTPKYTALEELLGVDLPDDLDSWASVQKAADDLVEAHDAGLRVNLQDIPNLAEALAAIAEEVKAHNEALAACKSRPRLEAFSASISELREQWVAVASGAWFIRPTYWRLKRAVQALMENQPAIPHREIPGQIDNLHILQRSREKILDFAKAHPDDLGHMWRGLDSEPDAALALSDLLGRLATAMGKGVLGPSAEQVLQSPNRVGKLTLLLQYVGQAWPPIQEDLATIQSIIRPSEGTLLGAPPPRVPCREAARVLAEQNANFDGVHAWSQVCDWKRRALASALAPVVDALVTGKVSRAEATDNLRRGRNLWLLEAAMRDRPELARFNSDLHRQRIAEFQELDGRLLQIGSLRVAHNVTARGRAVAEEGNESYAFTLLKTEINRKRRSLSNRQLLSRAFSALRVMAPCFMMSPLSVAQYLDLKSVSFDVVVFDEASQVRPEDAIGALMRGRQVIVVGDSQQLPPTSFFDHLADDEAEADTDADGVLPAGQFESILDLCSARMSAKNTMMLRWHYRSKHESLIAGSNREFYNNRLLTFPSIYEHNPEYGLRLEHHPHTRYDRSASRRNLDEARLVAQAVIDQLRQSNSTKSVGVVAMSIQQQQAIADALFELRGTDEHLASFFDPSTPDYVFVKNLETVQGDERDIIFISIGYGFEGGGQPLRANFGPITKVDGARRLNVLFTRARRQIRVFSNFLARDLDSTTAQSDGIRVLKVFLDYAENGKLPDSELTSGEVESPLEESIREFLSQRGVRTAAQVGCSGYRLDLAVINPFAPGEYLLAIECDGATYHSSYVARARDRQREEVLTGRGWKIHRVWSTDWWRHRETASRRLSEVVDQAIAEAKARAETSRSTSSPKALDSPTPTQPAPQPKQRVPAIAIRPFVPYKTTKLTPPRLLDPVEDTPLRLLRPPIGALISTEGPIRSSEIAARIGASGTSRKALRPMVEKVVAQLVAEAVITEDSGFFSSVGHDMVPRRRPPSFGTRLNEIAPSELAAGIVSLLHSRGELRQDDLTAALAENFGASEADSVAQEVIRKIISRMQSREIIAENDGTFRLVALAVTSVLGGSDQ